MAEPDAIADMEWNDLRAGMIKWATVDSPWLHMIDGAKFKATLESVGKMAPELLLSGHLPVARGMTPKLLDCLAQVPAAQPFVGPDEKQIEALLSGSRSTRRLTLGRSRTTCAPTGPGSPRADGDPEIESTSPRRINVLDFYINAPIV